jgi:hypothetical protein
MGITSCSSDSKTLDSHQYFFFLFSFFFFSSFSFLFSFFLRQYTPVEVLRGTDGDDGVGIGQAGEDSDPVVELETGSGS